MVDDWKNVVTPNSASALFVKRLYDFGKDYISQDRERTGNVIKDDQGYEMIAPYDKETGEYDLYSAEFIDRNYERVPKGYRLVRELKYKDSASKLLPLYNDRRMFIENDAEQMLKDYMVGKYVLKQ